MAGEEKRARAIMRAFIRSDLTELKNLSDEIGEPVLSFLISMAILESTDKGSEAEAPLQPDGDDGRG